MNRLLKKFFSFSYGSVLGVGIGFFTTLITTRLIDPVEFGKASMFVLALNVLVIFIMFGFDQSFIRFFYEEDVGKRSGLFYNSLKMSFSITIFVSVILLLLYKKVSFFLIGEENILVVILLIVGLIARFFARYGNLVIRMNQKGNLFSIIEIIKRLSELLIIFIAIYLIGYNYQAIVYSTIIPFIIIAIIAIFLQRKFWSLKYVSTQGLKHSKKDIFKYGFPLLFTVLLTWLLQSFDRIAIRQWSSFSELGYYTAAHRITALLVVFQTAFTTFWTPVSYEKFEKAPNDRGFFSKITNIVSVIMFFISIITIMFKDIIIWILGPQYGPSGAILPFLIFIPLMYTISETTVIGINFLKKPNWHIVIATIACISNIIGNWILVPEYGGMGAAISTAFCYVIFFSTRTILSLKYYKVDYKLKKIYAMIFIISLYAVVSILLESFYISFIIGSIILVFTAFVNKSELKLIYKSFNKKRNKI